MRVCVLCRVGEATLRVTGHACGARRAEAAQRMRSCSASLGYLYDVMLLRLTHSPAKSVHAPTPFTRAPYDRAPPPLLCHRLLSQLPRAHGMAAAATDRMYGRTPMSRPCPVSVPF